jgi:nickel/cobalt exporter
VTPTRATPRRRGAAVATVLAVLGLLTALSLMAAPAASAHPLGNATVNHYDGLRLFPGRVAVRAIEDTAEIPTLQRAPDIDSNGDGALSVAERAGYAARQCRSLAAAERVSAGGNRLALSVLASDYTQRPGAIQLSIGRLVCQLQARAELSRDATVTIDDQWDSEGIGWHEITAVGDGVSLQNSPFPASSISDELLH